MSDRYHFSYSEETVYGHVMALVRRHAEPGGCIVDLGCGFGAIAEPCRDAGFDYIGLDLDESGLKDLRDRGFDAATIDLRDTDSIEHVITGALAGRPLAAITMLDTLEHLTDGTTVLGLLRGVSRQHQGVPLVVSIPNVSHLDVAVKLLLGRWDVTTSGLLDDTHVAMYSPGRLDEVMATAGWGELAANDYELRESDQHFPRDLVALSPATPVHALLRDLRVQSAPAPYVNQFVRVYGPAPRRAPTVLPPPDEPRPFLSVITRTQGRRLVTLHDTLLCLAAQTCDDFELLLACHDTTPEELAAVTALVGETPASFRSRMRILPVRGGGRARPLNVGIREARGHYIAVIDDDDLAIAHWVEEFRTLGVEYPGRILRAVVAEQQVTQEQWDDGRIGYATVSEARCPWPASFDLLDHLVDNFTPLCGLAFPRSIFTDLGHWFDEELDVLEDWDLLLRVAPLTGVASTPAVTSVYRRWMRGDHSAAMHAEEVWEAARQTILGRLNSHFFVGPPGTVNRIRSTNGGEPRGRDAAMAEVRRLRAEVVRANQRVADVAAEFKSSASWRATKPLRWFGERAAALRARRVDKATPTGEDG